MSGTLLRGKNGRASLSPHITGMPIKDQAQRLMLCNQPQGRAGANGRMGCVAVQVKQRREALDHVRVIVDNDQR